MKVILVNGSPKEKGCTYTALKIVSSSLNEEGINTEIFWIGNKPIISCTACKKCKQVGKCIFEDTVNLFVKKAYDADGFVFASPVHYAGITGAMSSFLGRVFMSNFNGDKGKAFVFKPGAVVSCARRSGTTSLYSQLIKFLGISQMPIISSRYWNNIYGSTPEEVLCDKEGIQTLKLLGKNMAYFLHCQEAGFNQGILPPHLEAPIFSAKLKHNKN